MKKIITVAMLLTGLLPLLAVASLSALQATMLFEKEAQSRLEAVLQGKKNHVEDYIHGLLEMNESLAENAMTIKAMRTFDRGFNRLNFKKIEQTREGAEADILEFYQSKFSTNFEEITQQSLPFDVRDMIPPSEEAVFAQWTYIANNSNPLGSKEKLLFPRDGTNYSHAHKLYHPFFTNIQKNFDLYDIFLIDAKTRRIVYSVFKEIDYGKSVGEGVLRDTGLGKIVDRVLASPDQSAIFQDMDRYLPSYNDPASFMAAPIFEKGKITGVLAIQLPADRINKLANVSIGMGETGQSLLVGEDNLLRAQPRLVEGAAVLNPENSVSLESVSLARAGKRGVLDESDGSKDVLTAYAPIEVKGFNWALLVQMDKREVLAGSYSLIQTSLLLLCIAVVVILLSAWFVGRVIYLRIGGDPSEIFSVAESIAQGDLRSAQNETGRGGAYAALIQMRLTLAKIIDEVSSISGEVSQGAEELSSGNYGLSSRTDAQATDLQRTASSMEAFTLTVKQNADNADSARELANTALTRATKGGKLADKTVHAMEDISTSSSQIVEIIGVIDSIAFQTNLLALNAAVEAARAGEQGRGFAVVATEVRQLASRSATAAQEIKALIEDSVSKVSNGTLLVRESGDELTGIVESVAELSELVQKISVASAEQSAGVEGVNQSLNQIDSSTKQNAAMAERAAATSESMKGKARVLSEKVKYFIQ